MTEQPASRVSEDRPGPDPRTDTSGSTEAPVVAGDDVRPGPEMTDEPQAGGTEPTD